jgi:TP901 family phage tail tape measure protein
MGASVYELSLLLTLKDMASGGLDRFEARLRRLGPESRRALEDYKKLREDAGRGIAIGGAGVATLALLNKGVQAAGNYEAALTDMRVAFAEAGRDGAAEMNKLTVAGERLGQRLPGTTQDFLELFTAMKQGGISTQTILDGAGESVAHLAVTMKRAPKELAEPFAAFGQQFQLAGKDYIALTDLMSRARATAGIMPEEIIMASKYAQLRGGLPLGFKGLEGASTMVQLLTLLRRSGMSGEQAGTNLATFLSRLTLDQTKAQVGAVELLEKTKGIKLNFFDDKGQFAGVDNMMQQLEKLRGLNPKERIGVMRDLFEAEGAGVANIFAEGGLSSLQATNEEMSRKIGLTKEISEQTATYNAKMEALLGTLENVKAITFMPMLNTLKPMVDVLNKGAGAAQDFSQEHQSLASAITHVIGVGGVALTLWGAYKTAASAIGLYRFVSQLGAVSNGVAGVGVELGKTNGQAGMLRNTLRSIAPMIKVAIVLEGAQQVFAAIQDLQRIKGEFEGKSQDVGANYDALVGRGVLFNNRDAAKNRPQFDAIARQSLEALKLDRGLEFSLHPERAGLFEHFFTYQRPYDNKWTTKGGKDSAFDPKVFAEYYRASDVSKPLADPNVMAAMIRYVKAGAGDMKLNSDAVARLLQGFQAANPQAFAQAMALVTEQERAAAASAQNLSMGLRQPISPLQFLGYNAQQAAGPLNQFTSLTQQTNGPLGQMGNALRPLPGDLYGLRSGISNASSGLNSLGNRFGSFQIQQPQFVPTPAAPPSFGFGGPLNGPFNVIKPPAKAAGGRVKRSGLAVVHEGEDITPADVTARYETPKGLRPANDSNNGGNGKAVIINGGINIHLPPGAKADPRMLARMLARELEIMGERA